MKKNEWVLGEAMWKEVYNEPCSYYSIQHILKEAENGDTNFQCVLGYCYTNGEGIGKDEKKAFEWFKKAAEQGHAHAQFCVSECYAHGSGVSEDSEKAFEWLLKSADNCDIEAQYRLDGYYTFECGIVYDEDVEMWLQAAENGNLLRQYDLACFYYNIAEYKEAFKWFNKAAEQGHLDAQCAVADCYANGDGVEKDEKKAFEWYMKAAERGHAHAQYCVADSYLYGSGVAEDEEKALEWMLEAAENGHKAALQSLA